MMSFYFSIQFRSCGRQSIFSDQTLIILIQFQQRPARVIFFLFHSILWNLQSPETFPNPQSRTGPSETFPDQPESDGYTVFFSFQFNQEQPVEQAFQALVPIAAGGASIQARISKHLAAYSFPIQYRSDGRIFIILFNIATCCRTQSVERFLKISIRT